MDQQLLKDFAATADAYGYNWETVFEKFPELEGQDQQVLKDYVATAAANNWKFESINSKFPELFPQAPEPKEDQTQEDAPVTEENTASTSEDGSSES